MITSLTLTSPPARAFAQTVFFTRLALYLTLLLSLPLSFFTRLLELLSLPLESFLMLLSFLCPAVRKLFLLCQKLRVVRLDPN